MFEKEKLERFMEVEQNFEVIPYSEKLEK